MDLHLHTPASSDYQEPNMTWLDILQAAEARGLDIIGFTDHNTVDGYRRMRGEIEQFELLERLDR
ncbi:MAG: PHP domain-containing protein, partial [Chloroflexi bacterium]|nr:PHP domain-containing protein [Chloroflexota bacterium]